MNKKSLGFFCAVVIVLALVMLSASTAWAKELAPLTLEYGDIATRVVKDNKTLDVLQRSMPLLTDAKKEIEKAKREAQQSSGGAVTPPQGMTTGEQFLFGMLSSMMPSGGSINTNDIDASIDTLTIRTKQTEATLINGGQQMFVGYYALQDLIADMQGKRLLLEDALNLAKTQLTAGLGTQLAVKEAELAIAELDSGLIQLEIKAEDLLNSLKQIIGRPLEQELILGPLPAPDREFIAGIDLAADIITARANSYSLQLEQVNYVNTFNSRQKHLVGLGIEAMKESLGFTLAAQYNKLLDAENTLSMEEQRLTVEEEKIKQARLQHQLGLLSELALQGAENAYTAQKDAVDTAMDSLFWEIENYKALVAGLS